MVEAQKRKKQKEIEVLKVKRGGKGQRSENRDSDWRTEALERIAVAMEKMVEMNENIVEGQNKMIFEQWAMIFWMEKWVMM